MRLQTLTVVLAWATGVSGAVEAAPDYPALLGADWRAAEKYAAGQREAWGGVFEAFGVDGRLAEAVVFPELVRYSTLRDIAETAAVRALYQQKGSEGADFSIGRFQMKPSFAERVEREWMSTPLSAEYGIAFDTADNTDARRARIRRLDDPLWQCAYLSMFLRLFYARHPALADADGERQAGLCAAAYNGGAESLEDLERLAEKRFFHTDFIPGPRTTYYSYSDIARYYYQLRITNYEFFATQIINDRAPAVPRSGTQDKGEEDNYERSEYSLKP